MAIVNFGDDLKVLYERSHGKTYMVYGNRNPQDGSLNVLALEILNKIDSTEVLIKREIETTDGTTHSMNHKVIKKKDQNVYETQEQTHSLSLDSPEEKERFRDKWQQTLQRMLGAPLSFDVPTLVYEFLHIEDEVFQSLFSL